MSYLKFGFHLGPGGNARGHNEFIIINALDNAGIPFFVKSADDMPFYAQELAVALHEYSLTTNNIWNGDGWLVGRFRFLYDVCGRHDIPRPTVHITEWSWTLNDVPIPDKAMNGYDSVGELYAQYPQLKGAATWYLGPGWGNIANQAQKLILPLQELTLHTRYPDPEPPQRRPTLPTSVCTLRRIRAICTAAKQSSASFAFCSQV